MLNAKSIFNQSIFESKQNSILHDYLTTQVRVPAPFDDLLRGQLVIVVAAFDKLLHDIIRIGMCQTFSGIRPATPMYHSESISIQLHSEIVTATVPPKEHVFERAIMTKLGHLSFQHPDKVSKGLSLIWTEKHKWDKIGEKMGFTGHFASTQMKIISVRRNAIVHESDIDPLTNLKNPITRAECERLTDFVQLCGNAIVDLVIL